MKMKSFKIELMNEREKGVNNTNLQQHKIGLKVLSDTEAYQTDWYY